MKDSILNGIPFNRVKPDHLEIIEDLKEIGFEMINYDKLDNTASHEEIELAIIQDTTKIEYTCYRSKQKAAKLRRDIILEALLKGGKLSVKDILAMADTSGGFMADYNALHESEDVALLQVMEFELMLISATEDGNSNGTNVINYKITEKGRDMLKRLHNSKIEV
ncbi:MAG: hypothetical protein AAF620_01205 [Bacteroidota bacterium]